MNNIRARKSRRKKKVNSTKMGVKRKRKQKRLKVLSKTVAKAWDDKQTVKQNFSNLGLAFDPNTAVPLPTRKGVKEQEETMEVDKPVSSVIKEFEQMAATAEAKTERHISPGEAQFLFNLIKEHGDNYKAMVRDKRNYYQHTAQQLKRKCQAFLSSSQDFSQHLQSIN